MMGGTAASPPEAGVEASAPMLISSPLRSAASVLSGGSEKTLAVMRSFGRRKTSGVTPNWVTRP
jgi:hypothetical protein